MNKLNTLSNFTYTDKYESKVNENALDGNTVLEGQFNGLGRLFLGQRFSMITKNGVYDPMLQIAYTAFATEVENAGDHTKQKDYVYGDIADKLAAKETTYWNALAGFAGIRSVLIYTKDSDKYVGDLASLQKVETVTHAVAIKHWPNFAQFLADSNAIAKLAGAALERMDPYLAHAWNIYAYGAMGITKSGHHFQKVDVDTYERNFEDVANKINFSKSRDMEIKASASFLNFIAVTGIHEFLVKCGKDNWLILHHSIHPFSIDLKTKFATSKFKAFTAANPAYISPLVTTKFPANPAGTAAALISYKILDKVSQEFTELLPFTSVVLTYHSFLLAAIHDKPQDFNRASPTAETDKNMALLEPFKKVTAFAAGCAIRVFTKKETVMSAKSIIATVEAYPTLYKMGFTLACAFGKRNHSKDHGMILDSFNSTVAALIKSFDIKCSDFPGYVPYEDNKYILKKGEFQAKHFAMNDDEEELMGTDKFMSFKPARNIVTFDDKG